MAFWSQQINDLQLQPGSAPELKSRKNLAERDDVSDTNLVKRKHKQARRNTFAALMKLLVHVYF